MQAETLEGYLAFVKRQHGDERDNKYCVAETTAQSQLPATHMVFTMQQHERHEVDISTMQVDIYRLLSRSMTMQNPQQLPVQLSISTWWDGEYHARMLSCLDTVTVLRRAYQREVLQWPVSFLQNTRLTSPLACVTTLVVSNWSVVMQYAQYLPRLWGIALLTATMSINNNYEQLPTMEQFVQLKQLCPMLSRLTLGCTYAVSSTLKDLSWLVFSMPETITHLTVICTDLDGIDAFCTALHCRGHNIEHLMFHYNPRNEEDQQQSERSGFAVQDMLSRMLRIDRKSLQEQKFNEDGDGNPLPFPYLPRLRTVFISGVRRDETYVRRVLTSAHQLRCFSWSCENATDNQHTCPPLYHDALLKNDRLIFFNDVQRNPPQSSLLDKIKKEHNLHIAHNLVCFHERT